MGSIIHYALAARESFAGRPLSQVDSLCLAWLSYLRLSECPAVLAAEGAPLTELAATGLRSRLVAPLHNLESSSMLVQAMAASPRFADVRACLHVAESGGADGRQFSATTFLLPGGGAYVAFRGTDDTVLGWKENVRLACSEPIGAQLRAAAYLEEVAAQVQGSLWVGGHSKGGNLAAYACGCAPDEVRERVVCCFSHDGPGVHARLRALPGWHDDVPLDKTVPQESLVGMLFERSQQGLVVVRSSERGLMQHAPFSWEVRGDDFVTVAGLDYDAWKLSQRLNDWLDDLGESDRVAFVELLSWLMDTTGEVSCSGLLSRWSSNAQGMRAALDAAPTGDRELFERVMGDLVATVTLGSRQEYARDAQTPQEHADAASRRLEDAAARANDHFAKLDRLTGR